MYVFLQTNDAVANEVAVFAAGDDGSLAESGRQATGGTGSGVPHLKSQGSVVLDGARLLVANAGSDDVSVFAIGEDGLTLAGRTPSGGSGPTSIAVRDEHVFVLNAGGEPNVAGFRLGARGLEPTGMTRALAGTDPAQVGLTPDGGSLLVTDRANDAIVELRVDGEQLGEPAVHPSTGRTPYGFDFTRDGTLIVTEAAGAQMGAASVSSYSPGVRPLSRSVRNTRSEVCWAAVTRDGRFAYVTNFGDNTISSYAIAADGSIELLEPIAASTRLGEPGLRDEALSRDGRFLYALDTDGQRLHAWRVHDDGRLEEAASTDGLPLTAAGLAAQ
jgi:6-phosphogluconolactonase